LAYYQGARSLSGIKRGDRGGQEDRGDWEHIVGTETTICSENNLPDVSVFWGEGKNGIFVNRLCFTEAFQVDYES